MGISRRTFLKVVAFIQAGLVMWPGARAYAEAKKIALPLDKVDKLKTVGGWTVLKVKDYKILFIRDGNNSVKALEADCTHQKCQVHYDPDKKNIQCECHNSAFDLTGKVLRPPATKALKSYNAKIEGDKIIIEVG
jgi:nitrite reductase/ring-hydroxylating ferredoxin subunit